MVDELTVIVVALLSGEALDGCVRAARQQCENILVVQRDGTIVDAEGRKVGASDRPDIPAKRQSAVQLAETPLVALLEDTVVPERGWVQTVTSVLSKQGVIGCGGPVRAADGLPAQTEALILSEYGRYNDRQPAGEAGAFPGCNFAFRRDALIEAMRDVGGLIDLPVFDRLRRAGKLVWAPDMAVTFAHAFPEGARLKTRFGHGRIYASSNSGLASRAATAAKSVLLPAVLTARTLKEAGPASPSTLGWLLLQHSAWAAGEFVGAVMGPSRNGLSQWQ